MKRQTWLLVAVLLVGMVWLASPASAIQTAVQPTRQRIPLHADHVVFAEVDIRSTAELEQVRELGYDCDALGACELELTHEELSAFKTTDLQVTILEKAVRLSAESPRSESADRATILAIEDYRYASNTSDYSIPDYSGSPGYNYSYAGVSGAPSGAVVTDVEYRVRIVHTWPGDLVVELANGEGTSVSLWNRLGGTDDGGYDDDTEYDEDIYLNHRWVSSTFDGDQVNQTWYLDVWDYAAGDTGYIDYLNLWIYYEEPDPDLMSVSGMPTTLQVNTESPTIAVQAENDGGTSNNGAINVSVLYSDGSDDVTFSYVSHSWADWSVNFAPGQGPLYDNTCNVISGGARDHVIEAADNNWYEDESHTLYFRVRPQKAGTLLIRIRTTMKGTDDCEYYNDHSVSGGSTATDQQGWEVEQYTIQVQSPPYISSLSPTSGPPGKRIVITGQNFGSSQQSGYYVRVGGVTAGIEDWDDTQIIAYVPTSLSTGSKSVYVHTWTDSNSRTFNVTSPPAVNLYNYPSNLTKEVNTWFDVCASVVNTGGSPADHGGITFSFPGLTSTSSTGMPPYTSSAAEVTTGAGTTFATVLYRDHGDEIFNDDGALTAQYLLVEGDRENFTNGDNRTLCVSVKAKQTGNMTIYVRGWMTVGGPNGFGPPRYREPLSGPTDQQGFYVYPINVNVVATPYVSSLSPTSGPPGKRIVITGQNFGSSQQTGYYVRVGGLNAGIESWSNTEIVAYVPEVLSTGSKSVYVHTWTNSNSTTFSVTPPVAVNLYNYPTSLQKEVNTWFDVCASVANTGGSPADHGGVTFSFPGLTSTSSTGMPPYTSSAAEVTTGAGTTFATVLYRDHGDEIYDDDGALTAQYLLVEGERENFTDGDNRTLCVSVKAKQTGNMTIYVRGWMTVGGPLGFGPPRYREPLSGPTDQQGYYVYPINVNVVATPYVSSLSPTSGPPGKRIVITGQNFGSSQLSGYEVRVGGVTAGIESWSDTQIVAYVPTSLSTGSKSVYVHTWTDSNSRTFSVTAPVDVNLYNYPSSIQSEVDVPFSICATVANTGGSPADHGGVSFSFPSLTAVSSTAMPPYQSAQADVDTTAGTTFATVLYRDHGDEIYDDDGAMTAEYLLVEGDRQDFTNGQNRTLCLAVTPKQAGDMTIYVRGWMTVGGPNGYGPPYYREPTSGPTDQQSYYVYPIDVTVLGPEADITSRSVAPSSITEGEVFQIIVSGQNSGDLTGWGGISVSLPDVTHRGQEADVTARASDNLTVDYYEQGDTIYDDGGPIPADYLLVEAYQDNWAPGETRTMTVTVAPKETGNFPVYIRMAMTHNGYASRDPASGSATDQQSYYVYVHNVSVSPPAASVDVPILMYHKIDEEQRSEWWVVPDLFERQMLALDRYGYTAVTFDDFLNYRRGTSTPPSKPVILTFDDGFQNFLTDAHPLLDAHDFESVSFLPTDYIAEPGQPRQLSTWDPPPEHDVPHLTWPEVQSLDSDVSFESHGLSHPHLLSLTDAEAEQEIMGSRADIEDHLGHAPIAFSYPFGEGAEDTRIRGLVQEAGYGVGVAAWGGVENTGTDDVWALKRIMIAPYNTLHLDPAYPDQFFMRKVDPTFPLPLIDGLTVDTYDLSGHARTTFYPGETIHFVVSAHNSGDASQVTVSLNADYDTLGHTPPQYDSHLTDPVEDVSITFGAGANATFEYYWTLPEDAVQGQYYHAVGFHDIEYVMMFKLLDWTTSFTVGSIDDLDLPAPTLTTQGEEIVPISWRSVISGSTTYQINAYALTGDVTTLQNLLQTSPLYGSRNDRSLVQAIAVSGPGSQLVTDPTVALELVVANNNISHHRYGYVWDAYEALSLHPDMIVTDGPRTDLLGNGYQVWAPAHTNGWWRDLFLYHNLDDYEYRRARYQEMLYALILQPEISQRMVEDGTALSLFVALAKDGLQNAHNIPDMIHLMDLLDGLEVYKSNAGGLPGFGVSTLSDTDYFNIVHYARYGTLPNSFRASQLHMVDVIGAILGPIGTAVEIHNEVLIKQFERSLVNQLAFLRMDQLERWINANHAQLDPALVQAFPSAKQDIIALATDDFSALGEAFQSAKDEFGDFVHYAEYLLAWTRIANALFVHNASIGLYTSVGAHALAPWFLAFEIALQLSEDMEVMATVSLAATLYKEFEVEFNARAGDVEGGNNSVQLVTDVGLLNNYGYYLTHYFYYHYLEVVELDSFWDWINPVNWPKIIGEALHSLFGSRQAVIEYFQEEVDRSYQNLCWSALPPWFTTRKDAVDWLATVISTTAMDSSAVTDLLLSPGAEATVSFMVGNDGGTADPFYLDISYPDDLALVDPPAGWQIYPPGTMLWGKGDILEPTHPSAWPLAERSEPFPAGQPTQPYPLTFRGDTMGNYEIRYRVAMVPDGLSHAETLVQRNPSAGPEDQQEYPVKTIDVTVMPPPSPSISADVGQLTLVRGEVRTFELTLDNSSGGASNAAYIDVSATDGLTITDISPMVHWERYDAGDLIWHRDGYQFPALNALHSMHANYFPETTTTKYRITVRAESEGTATIWFRTALNPLFTEPDYVTDSFVRDPSASGAGIGTDQQGWWAYEIPVTIQLNEPPQITELIPGTPVTLTAGTATEFRVTAIDPEGMPLSYRWSLDQEPLAGSSHSIVYESSTEDIGLHSMIVFVDDGIYQDYATWEIHIIDGSPPSIVHTPVTMATEGNSIHIASIIWDENRVDEARIYYRAAGAPSYQQASLLRGGGDSWSGLIPGEAVTNPQIEYYLWATDSTNEATHGSPEAPHTVVVSLQPDTEPPSIVHTPVSEATAGQDLVIDAYVSDNVAVTGATLHYRPSGQPAFNMVVMDHIAGTLWQATIYGFDVSEPSLEYYLTATDGTNTAYHGSEADPWVVAIGGQPDLVAPTISHVPVSDAIENTDVHISAFIFDDRQIDEARLYFRTSGTGTYEWAGMLPQGADVWSSHIPAQAVSADGVEYYLWATDGTNTTTHGSASEPHVIGVRPAGDSEGPTIQHTPIVSAPALVPLPVQATVVDNVTVASAAIHYRKLGDQSYSSAAMVEQEPDYWVGTIPAGALTLLDLEYYLSASDGTNVSTAGPYIVDVIGDTVAPEILHTPVTEAPLGQPIVISATVTDDTVVQTVLLCYRSSGSAAYNARVMQVGLNDTWQGTIPAGLVTPAGVDYYLQASDSNNTSLHGTPGEPHQIVVLVDDAEPLATILYPHPGDVLSGTVALIGGTAEDELSGVAVVHVSTDDGSTWVAGSGTANWTYSWSLPPADGVVYHLEARAIDRAGHVQTPGSQVSVTVDTIIPTGNLQIGDATYAISTSVLLSIAAEDGYGLQDMRIWNEGEGPGDWGPIASQLAWDLPPGDGAKTVVGQVRDVADNVSLPFDDMVILDTVPPESAVQALPEVTEGLNVTVCWDGEDATSGVASFDIWVRDGATGPWTQWLGGVTGSCAQFGGEDSHTYYFESRAHDNAGNVEVLTGGDGDSWTTLQRPMFRLYLPVVRAGFSGVVNQPPYAPTLPQPAHGATGQSVAVDLSWTGGDPDGDAVRYDVYLEADDATPDVLACDDALSPVCDPGTLGHDTHYYWQVVARDEHGATATGPVWDFTTVPPPNAPPYVPSSPQPPNGAGSQAVDVQLGWTGGDPDGDSVAYDVYLEAGDSTPTTLVCAGIAGSSCDPGTLSYGTHYYWQVVARDEHGATTTGPVWDFDTATSAALYVAPTGNDTNDCRSPATPCSTIQAAIGKASSGDTVSVAAGTYVEEIVISDITGLTVQGDGADVTVINGMGGDYVLSFLDASDVFWAGFALTAGGGVLFRNSTATFAQNVVRDCDSPQYSGLLQIEGDDRAGTWSSVIIRDNVIQDNRHDYGAITLAFYADAAITSNVVVSNVITSRAHDKAIIDLGWGYGVGHVSANVINNVIAYNTGSGVGCWRETEGTRVRNNIIVQNTEYGLRDLGSPYSDIEVGFNDVWNNAAADYYRTNAGYADMSQDPAFVGPGGGDFHLQPGSPCREAGKDGVDMGAYPQAWAAELPSEVTVAPPTNITPSSLQLDWTRNEDGDFASYRIYRSESPGVSMSSTPVATLPDPVVTTYGDSGLAEDVAYYYKVYVCDVDEYCASSSEIEARTCSTAMPYQAGWPRRTDSLNDASPLFADLDTDGEAEILLGSGDGQVWIWRQDGTEFPGWPRPTDGGGIGGSLAVGDVDRDGEPEIVALASHLYVFDVDGTLLPGWPQYTHSMATSPVLADINDDGWLEILVSSYSSGQLYAFGHDGTVLSGWPQDVGWYLSSTPSAGDIDQDGDLEIFVGSYDENPNVYAWHHDGVPVNGWPRPPNGRVDSALALGDIDGDGDLEIVGGGGYENNKVFAWHHDGTVVSGWPQTTQTNSVISSVALGDLDGNGRLEIVVGGDNGWTATGKVYAWHDDGTAVAGWPADVPAGWVRSSPALADVDGDGQVDILVGVGTGGYHTEIETGWLYAWSSTGALLSGFPQQLGGQLERSSPALGDVDGDGDVEIAIASWDKRVYLWDSPGTYDSGKAEWPKLHHDSYNSGLYASVTTMTARAPASAHVARRLSMPTQAQVGGWETSMSVSELRLAAIIAEIFRNDGTLQTRFHIW